jgi:hypothetical protein
MKPCVFWYQSSKDSDPARHEPWTRVYKKIACVVTFILSGHVQPQNLIFFLHGLELEVVKSFTYLGIILSRTGNFNLAK